MERLVELAQRYEKNFADHEEAAIVLTPYATAYRYPSDPSALEPARDEFQEALTHANDVFEFVKSKLPPDLLP